FSGYYIVVDRVFDVTAGVWRIEKALIVGLVLRKEQRNICFTEKKTFAQLVLCGCYRTGANHAPDLVQDRLQLTRRPRPCVSKPECGQDMKRRRFWSAIAYTDLD